MKVDPTNTTFRHIDDYYDISFHFDADKRERERESESQITLSLITITTNNLSIQFSTPGMYYSLLPPIRSDIFSISFAASLSIGAHDLRA